MSENISAEPPTKKQKLTSTNDVIQNKEKTDLTPKSHLSPSPQKTAKFDLDIKSHKEEEESRVSEEKIALLDKQISDLEETSKQLQEEYESKNEQMISGSMTSWTCVSIKRSLVEIAEKMVKIREARSKLLAQYLDQVKTTYKETVGKNEPEPPVSDPNTVLDSKICEGGCRDFVIDSRQGMMRCEKCGHECFVPAEQQEQYGLNWGDHEGMVVKTNKSGYSSHGHFKEILINMQGKRATGVNAEVIEQVAILCDQYQIPTKKRNKEVVLQFLKRLQQEVVHNVRADGSQPISKSKFRHYTEYYKQAPEIAEELSGIPPPILTPMQEDLIMAIYYMAIMAYKTSPRYLRRLREKKSKKDQHGAEKKTRKRLEPNNMGCHYYLYKICHLLGYNSFLSYLKLPKNSDNIDECDEDGWKHICNVYGWAYMPTR